MSKTYPYRARCLMRFQAQDGQFVINADQLVSVTGPSDDAGEWVDVVDEQGKSGSIPAGFMIPIEQEIPPPAPEPESVSPPSAYTPSEISPHPPQPTEPLPSVPSMQAPPVTPVASRVSSSSQESPTPSKGPPPPVAKSNALRDRIAMFNKVPTAASPPPNTRPKPPIARKPINFPAPVPPIQASQETHATSSAPQEDAHPTAQPGMSAADAEESVKASGSLKDRIRLLQQQQQQQAVVPDTSSTPPKPKREWKRPPPLPADESAAVPIPIGLPPPSIQHEPAAKEGEEPSTQPVTEPVSNATEDAPDAAPAEEEELARRRRIAERMAKLGGAKMGFGFPGPTLGPKPTVSPKQSSIDSETLTTQKDGSTTTAEESSSTLPPERIALPSIPKRAPPPRRKAHSPANVPPPSDAPLVSDATPPLSEAPLVSETPVTSEAPLPVAPESAVLVASEAPVAVAPESPAPICPEAPVAVPPEAPAPMALESPAAVSSEAPLPVASEVPAPDAFEAPAPITSEVPLPVAPQVPVAAASEAPDVTEVLAVSDAPIVSEAPAVSEAPIAYEAPVVYDASPPDVPQVITSSNHPPAPCHEDTIHQERNSDEVPTSPADNSSVNSDASREGAIQPTTANAEEQPLLADLTSEACDIDEIPAPPQRTAPTPANILMTSDASREDAAQSATSSNPPDSPPPEEDSMPPAINEYQLMQDLPTKPESSAPLNDPPDDNQTSQLSMPENLAAEPVGKEQPPSESKEEVVEEEEDAEEELARRRRIAERMAKLGGAKIGFGFPGGPALMAPRPAGPPKQHSSASEASIPDQSPRESTTAEDLSTSSPSASTEGPPMPTRATPPTRKAPRPTTTVPLIEETVFATRKATTTVPLIEETCFSESTTTKDLSTSSPSASTEGPPMPTRATPPTRKAPRRTTTVPLIEETVFRGSSDW